MRKVKLEKIKDLRFEGRHPNGVNEGHVAIGEEIQPPIVGSCYYLGSMRTSTVIRISDDNTFETRNSIYQLTELKE